MYGLCELCVASAKVYQCIHEDKQCISVKYIPCSRCNVLVNTDPCIYT